MAYRVLTERTIYVSQCPHNRMTLTDNPPRERYCKDCDAWIPYLAESYTGPEVGTPKGSIT